LKVIASSSPRANVVATDRERERETSTPGSGERPGEAAVGEHGTKFSNPTPTRQPGVSALPSGDTNVPWSFGRYTVPEVESVSVSVAAS